MQDIGLPQVACVNLKKKTTTHNCGFQVETTQKLLGKQTDFTFMSYEASMEIWIIT